MSGVLRRRALAVGAALLGFGGGVVASAPPAHAALINNSCGPNYSLPPTSARADVRSFNIGSTRVALRFGVDNDIPAYIYWASVSSAPAGTRVWMDWSDNGGGDWHRWRAVYGSVTPDAGDRAPHGARREAGRRPANGDRARHDAGAHRPGDWNSVGGAEA